MAAAPGARQPRSCPALSSVPPSLERAQQLAREPGCDAAGAVKAIEARINHDVKAVEYYVREQLEAAGRHACDLGTGPLRLHLRGHQQPELRAPADMQPRRPCSVTLDARIDGIARAGTALRGHRDARAHARAARKPDDARARSCANVVARLRRAPQALGSGGGAGQVERRGGQLQCARRARCPALDWPADRRGASSNHWVSSTTPRRRRSSRTTGSRSTAMRSPPST